MSEGDTWESTGRGVSNYYPTVPTANERESGTRNKKRKPTGKGPGRTRPAPVTPNQREGRGPTTSSPYVYPGFDPSSTLGITPGGSGTTKKKKKKKKANETEIEARPIVPISQIQVPVGSGQAITPNMQEAYIKEVTRLTLNLISSADSLLFAYNFTTIDRIASYMLEADDASQRSTGIVSNIRRAIQGVPLTELEIRDRLNDVVNLVASKIGDLAPSDQKLNLFGNKRENLQFQGGMPRINNRTSFYDLELDLPELSSPEYSVTYVIKCYDIS